MQPAVSLNISLRDYSKRWQRLIKPGIQPSTYTSYTLSLDKHILPELGALRVRQLARPRIRAFLADKLTSGLSRNTVRILYATLRAMLNASVEDGVILANPAAALGRTLRLSTSAKERESEIKAMDRAQLARFLAAAREVEAEYFPLFFTMARTGLRLGEALGLQWQDFDLEQREITVERSLSRRGLGKTKSGQSRRVDVSTDLGRLLRKLLLQRKTQTLAKGWKEVPPSMFCTSTGTPMDQSKVSKRFKASLKKAKLPMHFSPHSLRHTFASLLLQQGESPTYVQRQLGHASIALTVDTYGRWLPMGNKAAVDRLDDGESTADGSKVVANGGSVAGASSESVDNIGGPTRTRTWDLLIMSQLL